MAQADGRRGLTFLGLEKEPVCLQQARYVILPVPYEMTTSYGKGTKRGPRAILKASEQVELFDDELFQETYRAGIYTATPVRFTGREQKRHMQQIAHSVEKYLSQGKTVITLGGEHTVTVGALEPFLVRYPKLTVLQVDAHGDLRDTYNGTPYSHASVMRRLVDRCQTAHVGIRSLCQEEASLIRERGLAVWFARDLRCQGWQEEVVDSLSDPVYFTLDVDGLDPSLVPSTGTPEPGGLGWYDILGLLRTLCARRRVIGADITELSPQPGNHAPDFLVAKLIYRMIGYMEVYGRRTGGQPANG
jgi:agmatinase